MNHNTGCFKNPGEDSVKAIKRFMTSIKKKKDKRYFPKEFNSTADYFKQYNELNSLKYQSSVCLDFTNLSVEGFAVNEEESDSE